MGRIRSLQFILFFTILAETKVYGFIDGSNLYLGGLPLQDVPLLILFVYCFIHFRQIVNRINPINAIAIVYVLMSTIVIISMPFREDESLVHAFQVGRQFYIFLLVFVVEDLIYYSGNDNFVKKLILGTGAYYAFIAVCTSISPAFVESVWKGIGTYSGFKGETDRSGIYNEGLVFVHFSFILKILEIIYYREKRNIGHYLLLSWYFVGMFFMGYRAAMFSLLFFLLLYSFMMLKNWVVSGIITQAKIVKYVIGALLLVFVANYATNDRIFGLAQSVNNDLSGTTKDSRNTFVGREQRALKYQIPTIMNNHPYIGMGFIYKKGIVADKYKMDSAGTRRVRALYNVDFGYGTMWARYGIIGLVIMLFFMIRSVWFSYRKAREYQSEDLFQFSIVLSAFLVANYTWALLDMPQGLIILAFSIGIASEDLYKSEIEQLDCIS